MLEHHPLEHARLDHEARRRTVDHDLHGLMLGVLELPFGGFEELPRLACHHLHVLGAQAHRRPAAIHGGVPDADDEHALADLVDVLECHGLEPGDADVHPVAVIPARQIEFLAFRCTRADEHRIEPRGVEELAHAVDGRTELELRPHLDHVADFFVEHLGGQAERRNVGAHQPAGDLVLLEDRNFIAHGHEVVGYGERRRPGADAGDALTIFLLRCTGQQGGNIVAVIGSHPLEPADGDGLVLDAAAAAGGFARPVADAAQNPGEDVGGPVHHVGLGELPLSDQSDVFRNVGVRRTGPLTINYFMKIIGFPGIGRFHVSSS